MSTSRLTGTRNKVISCAECRRLKLRCDRQFPCNNCTKRGLKAICPEGSLPTRPKALLQETERLNRKNAELLERIRLLEDGLASLQAGISAEPHPLLAKNSLDAPDNKSQSQAELDEINDSLGTLTIDEEGRSLFLGQTAGIESFFRNELQETQKWEKPLSHSPSVLHSLGIFSSLHDSERIAMEVLRDYLPSSKAAWSLTENYFNYASWMYKPITKDLFLDQVYHHVYEVHSEQGTFAGVPAHNAALLFMVFALGSFFDPSHSSDTDDAEQYHQLARTALSCDAILIKPTMSAIRTLLLMGFYYLLREKDGPQHCWAMIGLASHMAQNIGLHRDSMRWNLDDALVQERRTLFWELYWFAANQSLNFGRPPAMLLAFCDCEQPRNMERNEHCAGEIKPSFHLRKYQFASECLSQVIEAIIGIKHTPYSTILALDRKVRDSQALKSSPNGASGPSELGTATASLTLQRFILKAICEMTLMYLHRRYFARAIRDYPKDILGCRYGPSVLATYRSACSYINLMRALCELQPGLASQYYVFYNHLLAAYIVVGSIATKCPTCTLAPSAVSELDGCFTLFERAASFGDGLTRPARALKFVSMLRDRAHRLAAAVQAGIPTETSLQGANDNGSEQHDELYILSGKGRLVSAKAESSSSPSSLGYTSSPSPPSAQSSGGGPAPLSQGGTDVFTNTQSALMDDLGMTTQQFNSEGTTSASGENVTMWDSLFVPERQTVAVVPDSTAYAWNQGIGLATPHRASPYTSASPSSPIVVAPGQSTYTLPPAQANPEEAGHGSLGTAISWDSDWQSFMHQLQLGVHYDNDEGS